LQLEPEQELDIKNGRISGKPELEPDIRCIPIEDKLLGSASEFISKQSKPPPL